jgi:uncharacterized protein (TIGR02217 family)
MSVVRPGDDGEAKFPIGTSLTKGLTFSSFKTPTWARRIQRSVSGRELVIQDRANPIWNWRLQYAFLRDFPSVAGTPTLTIESELRNLMEFYNTINALGDTFLYLDRDDWVAEDQPLTPGNGVSAVVQLRRSLFGAFGEIITAPLEIDEITVNGDPVPEDYTVDWLTGLVTLSSPPPDGAEIRASFTYYFRCRFMDDSIEFERFAHQLWSLRELKFRSVLL